MLQGDGAITLSPATDANAGKAVSININNTSNGGTNETFDVGDGVANISQINTIGVLTGNAEGDTVNVYPNLADTDLPSGLSGVFVQLGTGSNDAIDAADFQNNETLLGGGGNDTIMISASPAAGIMVDGDTGQSELDVYGSASGDQVSVVDGTMSVGGVLVNSATGTTSSGNPNSITFSAGVVSQLKVGQSVTGGGLSGGATIQAIDSITNSITLSKPVTEFGVLPFAFGISFQKVVVIGGSADYFDPKRDQLPFLHLR